MLEQKTKLFGKISESGDLEYAPAVLEVDGCRVMTSDKDFYKRDGWFPIIRKKYPDDGRYYTQKTYEEDGKIVMGWEEAERPEAGKSEVEKKIEDLENFQTCLELALAEMFEEFHKGEEEQL